MKIRTILIDDEYSGIRNLEILIAEFCPQIEIIATTTDPVNGIDLINNLNPDLLFVDVYMQKMSGFDLIENFSHKTFDIVLVSGYSEYALKAFKYNVSDFLLKPINIEDLKKTYHKILSKKQTNILKHQKSNKDKIAIQTNDSMEIIEMKNIKFISNNNGTFVIQLANSERLASKSLNTNNFHKDYRFVSTDNDTFINMKYIDSIDTENSNILINKHIFKLSNAHRESFFNKINMCYCESDYGNKTLQSA
jgi:two-component system LytT family response regulator